MKRIRYLFFFISFSLCLSFLNEARGQCTWQIIAPNPTTGVPTASNNPVWQTCENNSNFVVNFQTTGTIPGPGFTIIWGDGTSQHFTGPWNGTPAISHSYTVSPILPSKNDTTYNFQIILDAPNNACVKNGQVVIKKIPRPIIQIADGKFKVCAPEYVSFINKSENVDNTTTFFVQFGDGTDTILSHTSVGQTFTHLYARQTVNCVTSIRITAQKSGCLSFSSSIDPLYVWDKDTVVANVTPQRVCRSTDTVIFRNVSLWNCDGTRLVNGIPTSEGNTTPPNPPRRDRWRIVGPIGTLPYLLDTIIGWRPANSEVRLVLPAIGQYCGTVVHESFCGVDSAVVCVIFNPPPTANIGPDDTVCSGNILQLNNSLGTTSNVTYQWSVLPPTIVGVTVAISNATAAAPNFTFTNVNTTDRTVRIALTVRSTGGNPTSCSDRDTISIVIRPKPVANFTLNAAAATLNACDSVVVNFAETATNENKWEWDFNNDGVYDTVIVTAGVNPSPRKFFALSTTAGTNIITVKLRVTGANGCMDSITRQIRVFRSPIPAFTAVSVCVGKAATFNSSTTQWFPSGVTPKTYSWSFPGGTPSTSTAANPNNIIYAAAGTYVVSLTVSSSGLGPAGCPKTIVDTIRVEPPPITSFTMNGSTAGNISGCSPFTVNFGNTSTGAYSNFWKLRVGTASDTTSSLSPVKTYVNNGTTNMVVQVRLITRTQFGCADSVTKTVTIFPNPNASFTVSNNTVFCNPPPIRFTNTSTGAVTAVWNYGDGSPLDTVAIGALRNHQYSNNSAIIRVDTVKMIAINATGCRDTFMVPVQIFPSQSFSVIVNADSGCTPFTTSFTAINGAAAYIWDFGNGQGSASQNASTTFHNNSPVDTTYIVRLITITAFGCRDTSFQNIVVHPLPRTTFSENSGFYSGCTPFTAYFNTFNSNGPVKYDWDFNDGTTVNNYLKDTISHTFVNTTAAPLVRTVRVKGYNARGCATDTTRQITIYPLVEAKFRLDTVSCSPYRDTIINESTGATNYRWFINGILQTSMNNQATPVINLVNNSVTPDTFTITLQVRSPFSAACTDAFNKQVVINPTPKVIIDPDTMVGCQPLIVNFTNQTVGGNTFAWDFGDGNTSSSSAASVQHTYTNTGSIPVVRTVNLHVENIFGCGKDTTLNITVYPVIESKFTIDTVSCSPFRDTVINQSTNATNYRWFFDGVLQTTLNGQANPIIRLSNNSTVPDTVEIRLESESPFHNSCKDDFTKKVIILPVPKVIIDPDTMVGCQPLIVNFTNQTIGGSTFAWDFGDGNTSSSSAASVQHTYTNTGSIPVVRTVNLHVENTFGCSRDTTLNITVYPVIESKFTIDTVSCSPFRDTIINQSTNATNYRWFFDGVLQTALNGQANPIIRLSNNTTVPDTVEIRLESESPFHNSCKDDFTKTVIVLPVPKLNIDPDTTTGCHPLTIHFLNQSAVPAGSTYSWNFDNGNTSVSSAPVVTEIFINTGIVPKMYNVTLSITSPSNPLCIKDTTIAITVYPRVVPDFTMDTLMCSPFIDTAINTSVGGIRYFWKLDNGTERSMQDFPLNVITPGIHTLTLRIESPFACTNTISKTFKVLPLPQVAFIPDTTRFCHPATIRFFNQTLGAVAYEWDFGDGNTLTSTDPIVTHTFVNTGADSIIFPVKQTARTVDNCSAEKIVNITVFPQVISNFSLPDTLCSPYVAVANNTSTGATEYEWSVNHVYQGDEKNKSFTLINNAVAPRNDTIRLRAYSRWGCDSILRKVVTVLPKPNASFVMSAGNTCQPRTIQFTNLSTQDVNMQYRWQLGNEIFQTTDPSTFERTFSNMTSQTITYPIKLTCTNRYGCTSQFDTSINISPYVLSKFTVPEKGCSPFTFKPDNQSINASSYLWSWSDDNGPNTSPLSEPEITLVNKSLSTTRIFNITLTIISPDLCPSDTTLEVIVYPTPDPDFSVFPQTTTVFPNTLFTFKANNETQLGNYSWDFGDGTTSTAKNPGNHNYPTWGEYEVKLIIENDECIDSSTILVKIRPPRPIPVFFGQAEGCPPQTVQFQNASQYGKSYKWDFGDNTTSDEEEPVHTYFFPGVYNVELKVFGFEDGVVEQTIKIDSVVVHPIPKAFFKSQPKTVYLPSDPLVCYNLSADATSYEWDFGDGTNSTQTSPQHYYTKPGEYTIILTATNDFGCKDTFSVANAVIAESEGSVQVPNAFTPNPNGGSGGFFNPQDFNNDVFYPLIKGVQEYYLSIYNRWGELLFESRDLHIGWDGYYRGKICKQDVYVWKIEAKFSDGRRINKAGDVLLLR